MLAAASSKRSRCALVPRYCTSLVITMRLLREVDDDDAFAAGIAFVLEELDERKAQLGFDDVREQLAARPSTKSITSGAAS